jgi:hypothetical protein
VGHQSRSNANALRQLAASQPLPGSATVYADTQCMAFAFWRMHARIQHRRGRVDSSDPATRIATCDECIYSPQDNYLPHGDFATLAAHQAVEGNAEFARGQILRGFYEQANARMKRAISSSSGILLVVVATTWLLGGCAPEHAPEPYVAKRGWLGVEALSTGSDYASLGTAQEPVIAAQPVKPVPQNEWEIDQPEPMVASAPLDLDDEPVPKATPIVSVHRRAHHKIKRSLTKSVAPLCRPSNSRSSS